MKKKLLAMILAFAMVLSLASCGGSGNTAANGDTSGSNVSNSSTDKAENSSEGKNTVTVGLNGTVTDVAPYAATNTVSEPIRNVLYQSLFTTANVSSMETIPVIGKSWEWVDDTTASIEIYDYVHDVEGNPITASDVVFSYETCTAAAVQSDTTYIESIKATGDYTLELKLTTDSESTMVKLLSQLAIISQTAYEADPETTPGTTAYKLTSFTNGAEYVCEKTDNYWQTDELNAYNQQANIDKIVFQCIPEATQMTNALENGEIQIAINVDGREASRFEEGGEDEAGFAVDTYSSNFSLCMLFNCGEDSLCNDINLRKAILYAIDADTVVDIVLNGAGIPASDLGSDAMNGFNQEWLDEDYFSYDASKAADYLAQSSYNGETLKLEAESSYSAELELIQTQLSAIGINSEIQTFENALWQEEKVAGTGESSWDISLDGMGGSVLPNAWKVKFNPANFATGLPQTGYLDEELNELLLTAADTLDADDIEAFHDRLVEQAYAIGLYVTATKCVTVDTITDICYNNMGHVAVNSCNFDQYTVTE